MKKLMFILMCAPLMAAAHVNYLAKSATVLSQNIYNNQLKVKGLEVIGNEVYVMLSTHLESNNIAVNSVVKKISKSLDEVRFETFVEAGDAVCIRSRAQNYSVLIGTYPPGEWWLEIYADQRYLYSFVVN